LTATELLNAWAELDVLRAKTLEEMRAHPVLLCPVASIPAFRHGEREWTIESPPLDGGGSRTIAIVWRFPRNGAHRVRETWHDRFAESPDVLKSAQLEQTVVPVLDLEIGGDEFITMAGPCSVETEFQLMATANHVRRGGARILRGGAFKPRSSPYSFQGLGLDGLRMLARARQESGLAIVTEVMSEDDVPMVAEYADILQIGTRNMENYSLLEAAARSGGPISAETRNGRPRLRNCYARRS
jgi:hypothetical protein